MAFEFTPPPNPASYPSPNPQVVGNALSNLVANYQQSQIGNQQIKQNDLRTQQDQRLLDQSKAFAAGVPTNPDGTTNYAEAMRTLAKFDPNAVAQFAPIIQQQQNIQGANAPDPIFGGGGSSSGGSYKQPAAPAPGPWSGNSFLSTVVGAESEGVNSAVGDNGLAKGDWQFHDATWQRYAKNVPGADKFASADQAPPEVQTAVAETAPIREWGQRTKDILHAKFGAFDENQTIGQLAQEFGGKGGGTQVASAGASDAPVGYATSEKPAIPPVSAAAGSSIPRENAPTAVGAVGGAPAGGAPAPAGGPLAANNPAWAGLNASLPTGPAGRTPAVGQGVPSPAPQAQAPRAPVAPPQGSVASIAAGLPPQVMANVARAVGVAPDAPLTPQQAIRAKALIQGYAQRNPQQAQQQQAPQPAQGQPQQRQGGPIVPQIPLPKGFTDPQQAILAIDQDIARLGRYGPAANDRIRALEDYRERIAKSSAPVEGRPGQMFLDPRTAQPIAQVPYPNMGATLSPAALDTAAENYYQTGKLPPNVGRGIQGSGNISAIIDRATALHPDDDPGNWAQRQQSFNAGSAGQRLLATRTASLDLAENEASRLIPRVEAASKAVSRTQYPTLNKIIEAADTGTGDPNVIKLGIAVESLAQTYARVLSPTGTPTVGDKENAHAILDKAWSDGQIDAALAQMQKEIESAKDSLDDSRQEMGAPALKKKDSGGSSGSGSSGAQGASGVTSSGVKWSVQ